MVQHTGPRFIEYRPATSEEYNWTFSDVVHEVSVVIADWKWFVDHEKEINDWLKEMGIVYIVKGMTIGFVNERDYLLFKLKWF